MTRTAPVLALLAMLTPAWGDSPQPGAHFIENWDVDGNGAVSLEDIQSRRADVFAAFDADENGALDAEEYVFFDAARENDMKAMGGQAQGNGLQRAGQGMTLAFNDSDGDGVVSRAEFLAGSQDWFALLDRNSDGTVTSADFGRP